MKPVRSLTKTDASPSEKYPAPPKRRWNNNHPVYMDKTPLFLQSNARKALSTWDRVIELRLDHNSSLSIDRPSFKAMPGTPANIYRKEGIDLQG